MFQRLINYFRGGKREEERSLENPAVPLWSPAAYNYLGAPRSSAGVAVDKTTALGMPPVWRGVNLIAQKIARLPLAVYKTNKDGGREVDVEHPAQWLLAHRPSDLYTPYTFKHVMMSHALLHGNAMAWIVRNEATAAPEELIILNPEHVAIAVQNSQLTYVVRAGTEVRKLLPENVLHIKGLGHDGIVGYSVLDLMRESLGLGIAAARYGSIFFKNNGSTGPMIIRFPNKMDKEQINFFRNEWDKIHSGLDNSHKYAVLANGGEVQQFNVDNERSQFLQTREFEVACGVANILGVPAHKLGVKVATAYNSLESEERSFQLDTLDAWAVAWEHECEAKLLTENQQLRMNRFIEFDRRQLEQADYKTRSETLIAELNNGIRTENEVRAMLNLKNVSGADGDRLRCPVNLTFIDLLATTKDDVVSTDPDQPAEAPAVGPEGGQSPLPTEGDPSPVRQLVQGILKRWIKRVAKSANAKRQTAEWAHWPSQGLAGHARVLADQLRGAVPAEAVNALVAELRAELEAVTREEVPAVFERLDAKGWTERLYKGKA